MKKQLEKLASFPYPLRVAIANKIRCKLRGFSREHYYRCIKRAVDEALPLGYERLTVIEFGVAAGKGLIETEAICRYVEARFPIKFDIYGFDTGKGLPKPKDYRDTPWKWTEGWYEMDVAGLKAKLRSATLVLGDVSETVPKFLREQLSSPIGAVFFDLDYYSATTEALGVFRTEDPNVTLPRVLCYFDDIGSIEDVGVLRAIGEFNESQGRRKVKMNHYWMNYPNPYVVGWKIFDFHNFDHPKYTMLARRENPL